MKSKISIRLNEHVNTVEAALHGYLDVKEATPSPLYDAMKYSLYAGGKRIRPALTMEFCRLFGGRDSAAIPFACAVECIHTYSLIHDDLPCMDNDDLRRGKPTNHRVYGEATALLAGDGLLTFAFELLSKKSCATPEGTLAAVGILAECAGMLGMVGGQQLDLNGEHTSPASLDAVLLTHRWKTAALLRAACLLGCCAADVQYHSEKMKAAAAYAEHLGMAFQIMDDVLDGVMPKGSEGSLFPPEHDNMSVLKFMTAEEAKALAQAETEAACQAIAAYPENEFLIGLALKLAKRTH